MRDRPRDRLSGADQGVGRRRRPRHARGRATTWRSSRPCSRPQAEAEAAFRDGSVYLEKYIEQPRHVEVQILADQHGNVRPPLGARLLAAAAAPEAGRGEPRAAPDAESARRRSARRPCGWSRSAGYTNAGTCEFLVDRQDNFYFIEVNARIQVEHPVTEMVTGIDLIKQQIRIAAGEPLPFTQEDIRPQGAAIECRINAEDPAKNFQPCPGKIEQLIVPGGFGVRFDSHAHTGYTVPPYYDSMIGKLIVHQPTRRRGHRLHAAGAGRVADRGHQDHDPLADGDSQPLRASSKAGSTRRSSSGRGAGDSFSYSYSYSCLNPRPRSVRVGVRERVGGRAQKNPAILSADRDVLLNKSRDAAFLVCGMPFAVERKPQSRRQNADDCCCRNARRHPPCSRCGAGNQTSCPLFRRRCQTTSVSRVHERASAQHGPTYELFSQRLHRRNRREV